jgi:hypothetical protein
MAKKNNPNATGQYDKVFKENAEEIYEALVKSLLRIDTSQAQDLPQSDLQHTIERKADFLKKIIRENGREYALHIEIQADNHKKMDSRMLVYHALIYQIYGLDSQQFVIYIGNERLDMNDTIQHENMSFQYQIIDIRRYNSESFLQANTPEEVILAILGDFQQDGAETVIEKILLRLQQLTSNSLMFGKYATQLEIISQLRNLKDSTQNQIKSMPIVFDITQTLAYAQGETKGEAKTRQKAIENILRKKMLSPAQIADAFSVSLEYVLDIQAKMS